MPVCAAGPVKGDIPTLTHSNEEIYCQYERKQIPQDNSSCVNDVRILEPYVFLLNNAACNITCQIEGRLGRK